MATDYTADGNMVAYYYFEADPGIDKSGTGDNHVDDAASDPSADTVNYKQGSQSAVFESSSSEYLQCDNASCTADFPGAKEASAGFTVMAWVRLASSPTEHEAIASVRTGGGTACWQLLVLSTNALYWTVWNSDDGQSDVSQSSVAVDGSWTHVVGTLDSTDDTLYSYINGVKSSGHSFSGETLNVEAVPFRIGSGSGEYYFDHNIDELAIFNRSLSQAEIVEIMNNRLDGSGYGSAFTKLGRIDVRRRMPWLLLAV